MHIQTALLVIDVITALTAIPASVVNRAMCFKWRSSGTMARCVARTLRCGLDRRLALLLFFRLNNPLNLAQKQSVVPIPKLVKSSIVLS